MYLSYSMLAACARLHVFRENKPICAGTPEAKTAHETCPAQWGHGALRAYAACYRRGLTPVFMRLTVLVER